MGLTPQDLQDLLAAFEESTWQEMTVCVAGDTLRVSRREGAAAAGAFAGPEPAPAPTQDATPPLPSSAMSPSAAVRPDPVSGVQAGGPSPAASTGTPVPSPSVGLFWRAPSPGAPPFVEVGTRVGPEDAVGIVEVMKLMNRVAAGVSGVVTAVLVENGGMVEHGQPLALIDPTA